MREQVCRWWFDDDTLIRWKVLNARAKSSPLSINVPELPCSLVTLARICIAKTHWSMENVLWFITLTSSRLSFSLSLLLRIINSLHLINIIDPLMFYMCVYNFVYRTSHARRRPVFSEATPQSHCLFLLFYLFVSSSLVIISLIRGERCDMTIQYSLLLLFD